MTPGVRQGRRIGRLWRVSPKTLTDLVALDWAEALAPVEDTVARMDEFLRG
jgi:uracil-DNA glycosylase